MADGGMCKAMKLQRRVIQENFKGEIKVSHSLFDAADSH